VAEIARANAGAGLNLLITHFGADINAADVDAGYAINYEVGRRLYLGWNLRTLTIEMFQRGGRFDGRSWGANLGYRIGIYPPAALQAAAIPESEAPCVWLASRDEARGSDQPALAWLFGGFKRPRCGFTSREQQSLLLALGGHTDEGIAQALTVSNSTAKRLFRSIYEKAERALGAQHFAGISLEPGIRGPEIRRRMLNFVREHPEELRPYDARAEAPNVRAS
jgi:hypothetical protein